MLAVSRKLVERGGQYRAEGLLHNTQSPTAPGPAGGAEESGRGGWVSLSHVETGIGVVIFRLTPTDPPHTPLVGFSSLSTHPTVYFRSQPGQERV